MSFLFMLWAALAEPAPESANPRYLDCVTLVEADLEIGRTAAQQWVADGGGADAHHCLAVADIAAGYAKLGAVRLEEIAQRKDAGDDFIRARLLSQAAEAWLKADEPEFADTAIQAAFTLAPDAAELHSIAALVHAANQNWQKTIASASVAIQHNFESAGVFVARGRAYAALGDYQLAANDVVNALNLNPSDLDALVLRGEIQQTGIGIEVYFESENSQN